MGNIHTDTIPIWQRYTMTIEEAAQYYHIGENKLRSIVAEHSTEDFYLTYDWESCTFEACAF